VFNTADEVAQLHQERRRRDGRRPLLRPARGDAALHRAGQLVRRGGLLQRSRVRRFVDPRLPGDPRVDMLLLPDPTTARLDPFRTRKTLILNFFIHDPLTVRPTAATRATSRRRPRPTQGLRHRRHRVSSAPRRSFYIFDSIRYDSTPESSYYYIDAKAAAWNTGKDEVRREPGLQAALQGRLTSRSPPRPLRRPARRDGRPARGGRHAGRAWPPRGGLRRPGRDQLQVRHAAREPPTT